MNAPGQRQGGPEGGEQLPPSRSLSADEPILPGRGVLPTGLGCEPRNADAHLGLGIIHSDSAKLPEYGFAYYHLRRYVTLSGRTNDLIVNQLIRATGLRLAELHADTIGKIQTQGQLEQMRRENDELRKSALSLSNQLYSASTRIATPAP